MNHLYKTNKRIIRIFGLVIILVAGILSIFSTGGGGDFYMSPCFPFPESWCVSDHDSLEPPDTVPPTAPSQLVTVAISPSKIELTWSESTDNAYVIGYQIFRDSVYISYVDRKTTNTTDSDLEALTHYCYTVVATDNSGNDSEESNQSCTTTLQDTVPPTVPENLTATYVESDGGGAAINLSWSSSIDDGIIAGYKIYRDSAYLATETTTTYSDFEINPLTNYCYAISAYDKSGNESVLSEYECVTSSWLLSIIKTGELPTYNSIAVDSNNIPHLSYISVQEEWDDTGTFTRNNYLKYTNKESGDWSFTTIDSYATGNIYDGDRFVDPYLRINSDDNVHIAYINHTGNELIYTSNSTGIWDKELVVEREWITNLAMVLDSADHANIGFVEWFDLKYATNTMGTWETELIDDSNPYYPSIAIDLQNNIHVSWYDYYGADAGGALKYATNTSGAWVVSIIDITMLGGINFYPTIVTDNVGQVHIIYFDETSKALMQATKVAGSWVKTIINNLDMKTNNSVYIDSKGKLHISYVDNLNHILLYSNNVTGSWQTYTIDAKSWVTSPTTIAVDFNNDVHISYRGSTELRYATTQ